MKYCGRQQVYCIPESKKGAPLRGRLYKRGVFAGAQGAEIRLSAVRYPLSVIRYPLSVIRYPLSAVRFPLDTVILSVSEESRYKT